VSETNIFFLKSALTSYANQHFSNLLIKTNNVRDITMAAATNAKHRHAVKIASGPAKIINICIYTSHRAVQYIFEGI